MGEEQPRLFRFTEFTRVERVRLMDGKLHPLLIHGIEPLDPDPAYGSPEDRVSAPIQLIGDSFSSYYSDAGSALYQHLVARTGLPVGVTIVPGGAPLRKWRITSVRILMSLRLCTALARVCICAMGSFWASV